MRAAGTDPVRTLIEELGDWLSARAVRGCIARLQRMETQLSEGQLRHLWDEVCAQVQGEESIVSPLYEEVVRDTTRLLIEGWPRPHLQAVWLQTDEGIDWLFDEQETAVPVNIEAIVEMLEQRVYSVAANISNSRIEMFNAREHD